MRIEARIIPVEGVSEVPLALDEVEQAEARRQRRELLLLNVAAGLSILLVCCAWVAIALD
ncbi:MAG: hypothetical protein ACOY5F_16075 [Pseudomonadota bacterium]